MSKKQDPTMKLALKIVAVLKKYAACESEGLKVLKIAAIHYSTGKESLNGK